MAVQNRPEYSVKITDVKVLSGLDDGDKVIIFYSDVCKNGSLDFVADINLKNAEFRCQKVKIGTKNALDFQLASYLGYLVGTASEDVNIYIISNDKGYDCLTEYWKINNVNVSRITISNLNNKQSSSKGAVEGSSPTKKASKVPAADRTSLTDINKYLSKGDAPIQVMEFLNRFKTKKAIYKAILKQFKNPQKAEAVYQKLKPLLKEKNKT